MHTPSHFLMGAALDQSLPRVPIVRSAFLLGFVAPDIPLYLLSIGTFVYYHFHLGWSMAETAHLMFDQLFFHHPVWIAGHNLLHSPTLLIMGLILTWRSRRNLGTFYRWGFWFLLACLLHTSVDILTHADDGPLLWFPFDWSSRFHSPVSYWDHRYYGREFGQFERGLNGVLLLYCLVPRIHRRWQRWRSLS